ncbi:MAG: glycosyltransferase family 4 protein, partial [Pseudomonadota bacterium]|nr:glycosyltransferase family 4 protein [Pseudomonadota bacterium]
YPSISSLDFEESKSIPNKKNHPKTSTNFLMLATYEKHKGHDLLFDSIVKVLNVSDKFHFKIAGHGTSADKEHIVKGINSRKLSKYVSLMDFQSNPLSLYKDCDVVVIPSIAYDSISLVAVEAMSLRKPIITTNIGGLEELFNLNPHIGLMSKIDHEHFSKCLIKIIENHEIRTTMGNNGYNLFREYFTAEIFAQKFYKNVIE